uniref:DUF4780 domain-containing protein n=2 Tax=Homalodisca liturata TaxID=320908 RepID=A0A1B6K1V5_9HEMI
MFVVAKLCLCVVYLFILTMKRNRDRSFISTNSEIDRFLSDSESSLFSSGGESDYIPSDCSDTESSSVEINENGDDVEGEVELPYVQEDVHMELVDGYNNNKDNVINLDPNVQFAVNAVHDRYDNVQGTPEAHQRKKTKNEGNQGERKEQSGQPQKPSYKQAVAGIRVGVLHSNFPETLLTTEQMEKIQSFILEAIVEEQEGPYSPRFYGINRRQGVLILTCENTETAEWLKGKQDSLKPWEEASLRIVPEEEIPRARIATVYLPDSILDTTEKIMKLLKGQNKELSVGEWNVLRRSDEGKSVLLTLAIDCATANKLEKEGPWIGYKFGKVQLRLKKKHQGNIEQPTREEGTTEKSKTVTTEKMTAEEMEVEEATKVSEQSVHTLPKRSTPQASAAVEEERPTCSLFLKKGPSLKGPSVSARGRKGDKVSKQSRRRDGDGPPGGGGKKA